ncbi:ABC transporter substrate-binding protein [Nesterenkonia alba]|uniref:ABC transporter substrate-binding protein n=1 Tax=Nesterenkonia alba TaxID=515814 RepID=UPI0003B6CFF0|nr:sugar ABC transporter substrate-binding protein [Nesterenkonia alba]
MRRHRPLSLTSIAATTGLLALTLTSCAQASGDSDNGDLDPVDLRFSWWSSQEQHINQSIIEAFEEEYPHISVTGEYTDWSSYWDQLATQAAANDAPDVIMMDNNFVAEYAERGTLLELSDVDVSEFPDDVLDHGRIDGEIYALSAGLNTMSLVANPRLFEEAGVELPDDTTWDWEEYAQITAELSENLDDAWGMSNTAEPSGFQTWLRQQGDFFVTDDGELGFTEDDAAEYFQYHLDLMHQGALPPADVTSEVIYEGADQHLTGTGRAAIGFWWSNQLPSLREFSGDDLILLRFPSRPDHPGEHGMWFKSSMFVSAASTTEHPEEAQLFIDFLLNDETAGTLALTERGYPANLEIREVIASELDESNTIAVDFLEDLEDEIETQEPLPPIGFGPMEDIFKRYQIEVFFERMTPEEAATAMYSEMESSLSG